MTPIRHLCFKFIYIKGAFGQCRNVSHYIKGAFGQQEHFPLYKLKPISYSTLLTVTSCFHEYLLTDFIIDSKVKQPSHCFLFATGLISYLTCFRFTYSFLCYVCYVLLLCMFMSLLLYSRILQITKSSICIKMKTSEYCVKFPVTYNNKQCKKRSWQKYDTELRPSHLGDINLSALVITTAFIPHTRCLINTP